MSDAALDYSRLAAVYDDYCAFAGDVPFFVELARSAPGEVLELMAGTGRISLPLVESGARLTCVDSSLAMLAVQRRKLAERGLRARLVCADVRDLPLAATFPLVLLPFQGLTELLSAEAQLAALRAVAAVLADSGRFVCTSHNPAVRMRTVDDTWQEVSTVPRADGGTLTVSLRCRYDARSGNVVGQQRLVFRDAAGAATERLLDLRFRLVSLAQLRRLCEQAGLRILDLRGDYTGARFDPISSPAIIAVLGRAGQG